MTLTHNTQVRRENDPDICSTLIRKGWIQNEPPSYDPTTHAAPVWDGLQWTSATLPPPPPMSVSMVSLKLALVDAELYDAVASAVATSSAKFQILWTNTTAARNNPDLIQFASDMGLSDAHVDAIFAAAKQLDNT